MAEQKQHIHVTQRRGLAGKPEAQRLILKGLGLRRIGHAVIVRDTPAIRGMVEKVQHLVDVEVRKGEAPLTGARHRSAQAQTAAAKKGAAKPKAAK